MGTLARLMQTPEGRLDGWLLFVFVIVNGLVLFNAVLHDPTIQYDGEDHLAYISALAQLRLPTPQDSREFFSPPLPYFLPAVASTTGLSLWWAAKFGQAEMVRFLLSRGAQLNLSDDPPWATPLSWATRRGHQAVVEILRQQPRS